jgi:hypothetical protein
MKRIKLRKAVNRPSAYLQRLDDTEHQKYLKRGRVIEQLRDLPVERLSMKRQYVTWIEVAGYENSLHSISFTTKHGTVMLTGNAAMFQSVYRKLRDNFGPVAEPKRKRTSNTLDVQRG